MGGNDSSDSEGEKSPEDEIFGPKIKIIVKKATSLKNVVKFGTIDTYAEVTFEGYTKKTKVQEDTKNPEWNEDLEFPRANADSVKVQVKVFHKESLGKDKLLGYGTGTINGYTKSDFHDVEVKLIDKKQKATESVVFLGVGGGGDKDQDEEEGGDGDEEDCDEESGSSESGGQGGQGGVSKRGKKKKKKKKTGLSAAVEEARAKIDFSQLSTKEEIFQIRFVIHKARQLKGNIESPMVRVSVAGKILRTQSRQGKNPKFNETIVCSLTKSEKDLLNLPVELTIVDSAKESPYNLIGQYDFDLTVAWSEKDKLLVYKWFAMTDPDEPEDGMTGYLNVSIQILPPGEMFEKLPKKSETEIDVASNVFYPPGVTLQPGQFIIKLYTGEDFPQMDSNALASVRNFFSSGEKPADLVDPFVEFKFAGSNIESMIQYGTFDPVWGQKLVIHGQFPSMAEKFVVRVKDHDEFGANDTIATKLLKMSQIAFSSTDADLGFLPTFGPSYIPLYGSLREFSDTGDKYEDLNKGDEEGIAYRGRILMELNSNMGEADPALKDKATIPDNESDIVMSNLRRHKYHLFTSFDTGNMIREKDSQVEFEVSIGDYGNSLSLQGGVNPSTTQPSNAVFDGTHYYFMPWSSSKPAVILHSEWEDVEFRAETYNIMLWTVEFIKEELRKFHVLERARVSPDELGIKCRELIENVISEMSGIQLPIPPQNATKLDMNLHKVRQFHIGLIKKTMDEKPEFVGIDVENPNECVLDVDGGLSDAEDEVEEKYEEDPLIELSDEEVGFEATSQKPDLSKKQDDSNAAMHFDSMLDELDCLIHGALKDESFQEKLKHVESVLSQFRQLTFEPQISIPDVFIWVMSGTNRIAFTRIPVHQIIYTENERGRGKLCGKTGSFFLKKPLKEKIGAHLAMTIWFGKFEHVAKAFKTPSGSEVTVYAETYENEMSVMGNWTTKLLPRPKFSDITGKYEIPQDSFAPPAGWRFEGDWIVSVDKSIGFDNEEGLSVFKETAFEGQTRKPGASWTASSTETWWTDEKGDDCSSKEEIPCKEGWRWIYEVWELDIQRAVDSQGFEYADEADLGSYGPVERNYHLARRRLWARVRERTGESEEKVDDSDPEGWEYSKLFTTKFHMKEKSFDMVRRRRWNRKLVSKVPVPITFTVYKDLDDKDKDDAETFNIAPRIMTEFSASNVRRYQLRAYIYQARGLLGADATGYSDPYARVVFGNRSGLTAVINQTCSPLWDTSVILDNIEICGDKSEISANPPDVVIEFFDEDALHQSLHKSMTQLKSDKSGKVNVPLELSQEKQRKPNSFLNHDKLGRIVCKPHVMEGPFDEGTKTRLQWYSIAGVKNAKGELLAAFELFELGESELPPLPRVDNSRHVVPDTIRPKLARTRVEFLTWGLRELKDYKLQSVDSPHLEVELAGSTLVMDKIKSVKKLANFKNPHNFLDVMLPVEELYLPPINIRVLDNRSFGYTPLVGVCSLNDYGKYRTTYESLMQLNALNLGEKEEGSENLKSGSTLEIDSSISDVNLSENENNLISAMSAPPTDLVQQGDIDVELGEAPLKGRSLKSSKKSVSTENLIEKDVLAENKLQEKDEDLSSVILYTNPKHKRILDKKPLTEPKQPTKVEIRQQTKEEETKASNPDDILVSDWWSKYYECNGNDERLTRIFKERDLPKLKFYNKELESEYDFCDIMNNIPIMKPDNEISSDDDSGSDSEDEDTLGVRNRVGFFKGSLKIYEINEETYEEGLKKQPQLLFSNLPTNDSTDVLLRVYCVAAVGLAPLDFGGSCDPYLEIKCGKTTVNNKDDYITKDLNPIFGKMFQIKAKLPRDGKLSVKVFDHDLIGANDLIGSTDIDIEDRFLSWRRASCGLSQQYIKTRSSKDKWRDALKPSDILKRLCLLKGWHQPIYNRSAIGLVVVVDGSTYSLEKTKGPMQLGAVNETAVAEVNTTLEKNQLALQVLHKLGVIPEHIESRTLYNDDCPGIPQGKIHLWIDIFPYNDSIPPPISIAPRQPQKFVFRCIIRNTEDVILDEANLLGEEMSDIYVKCFLEGRKKEAQETDVHYRSLTGEGNFNWRMLYPLDFIRQENKMVQKKKGKFWHVEKTVMKIDPIFHIEVFDKDVLSRDDKLGWAQLDLTRIPAPTKTAKECSLEVYEDEKKYPKMSLFQKKKMAGFWPVFDDTLGTRELTGKVEMELEILTEQEAAERPAGKARDEPNSNPPLEPPNRPETSFNWFSNPWKVFKILIWRRFKWHIIIGIILILLILFAVLMFYSAPEAINDAIWN